MAAPRNINNNNKTPIPDEKIEAVAHLLNVFTKQEDSEATGEWVKANYRQGDKLRFNSDFYYDPNTDLKDYCSDVVVMAPAVIVAIICINNETMDESKLVKTLKNINQIKVSKYVSDNGSASNYIICKVRESDLNNLKQILNEQISDIPLAMPIRTKQDVEEKNIGRRLNNSQKKNFLEEIRSLLNTNLDNNNFSFTKKEKRNSFSKFGKFAIASLRRNSNLRLPVKNTLAEIAKDFAGVDLDQISSNELNVLFLKVVARIRSNIDTSPVSLQIKESFDRLIDNNSVSTVVSRPNQRH